MAGWGWRRRWTLAAGAAMVLLRAGLVPPDAAQASCEPTFLDTRANDAFSRGGRLYCFAVETTDGMIEVFIADLKGGSPRSLVKESRRCMGGSRAGQACADDRDCPGAGSCVEPFLSGCRADERGRSVYFILNGNPTGGNPDLGEELFQFDTRKAGRLTQVTTQAGWCANDPAKACTTDFDCVPTGGNCRKADMFGLHVAPDGKQIGFATNGDPGGNPGHGDALFGLVVKGKRQTLNALQAGGRLCSDSSAKRGQPCSRDEDCRPDCGDGSVDSPEQCDPSASPSGCSQGQVCGPGGTLDQCKCRTIACGNGLREPGEECEGTGQADCDPGQVCGQPGQPGACTCILTTKLCGNGIVDSGEDCDGTGCAAFQTCIPAGQPNECTCQDNPATCGNDVLEAGEQCDGTAFPCRPGFLCNAPASCTCSSNTTCGNSAVEPSEQCDPPGGQAQCAAGLTCDLSCRCEP